MVAVSTTVETAGDAGGGGPGAGTYPGAWYMFHGPPLPSLVSLPLPQPLSLPFLQFFPPVVEKPLPCLPSPALGSTYGGITAVSWFAPVVATKLYANPGGGGGMANCIVSKW